MSNDIPSECIGLLHELNAKDVHFFERNILSHLEGTYRVLCDWDVDKDLAIAGLFHAVYLTEFFVSNEPDQASRERVRAVIGDGAEKLAYRYCVMNRVHFAGLDRTKKYGFRDSYTGAFVELNKLEDQQIMELIWANSIEQMRASNSNFKENEQLKALFEASRHRVGKNAIAEFESLS